MPKRTIHKMKSFVVLRQLVYFYCTVNLFTPTGFELCCDQGRNLGRPWTNSTWQYFWLVYNLTLQTRHTLGSLVSRVWYSLRHIIIHLSNHPWPHHWILLGLGMACIGLSFFLSGLETGLVEVSRLRLRRMAREGNLRASRLLGYLDQPEGHCGLFWQATPLPTWC